jgi:single-strand DNA-binding protein
MAAVPLGSARPDTICAMTASDGPRVADNEVFLRGRLAAEPTTRILPSGDELVAFRITVARPETDRSDSRARVDSIDCAAMQTRARRCVERAVPGDELEVTGSLHRRFWRGAAGLGSRYEVLVSSARLARRRRSDA